MIHKNITLSTSNQNKLNEFKRFGLSFDVSKGIDIKEVASNIDDVILYKAIDAGQGILVEDTVLEINGEEIVDIRWRIRELAEMENPKINFIVSLGILDGDFIYIYRGQVECKLIKNPLNTLIPNDAFGFDAYLVPILDNNDMSFYTLEKMGRKDAFSPRKMAVEKLNHGLYMCKVKRSQVSDWNGDYQNS